MNKELREKIAEAVADFAVNDGAYPDNSMIEIDPATLAVEVVDEETDDTKDYYDLMDFVEADPSAPGRWIPFEDAIDEVASSYGK